MASQSRLAAAAGRLLAATGRCTPGTAAAGRSTPATPSAAAGRCTSRLHFQVRSYTSSLEHANGNGNGNGKKLKEMMEFVRDLREVFRSGIAYEELAALNKLDSTVVRLEERFKLLQTCFWVSVAFVLSANYAIISSLSSKETQLNGLSQDNKELKKEVKELEKRVHTLENASLKG